MALSIRDYAAGISTTSPIAETGMLASVGDVVIICSVMDSVSASYPTISTSTPPSDGTSNIYQKRNGIQYTSNSAFGSGLTDLEIWWTYIATALTVSSSISITTAGGALDNGAFMSFSVTGFTGTSYRTNPWDQSATTALGFAVTNNGATRTQLTSGANVSTANAATLTFAFGGSSDNGATVPFFESVQPGPLAGTTGTSVTPDVALENSGSNAAGLQVEYRVLAATISSASAAFASAATAGGWGIMVDALSQTGGATGLNPYNPWPQQGPILAQRRKSVGWLPPRYQRHRKSGLLMPNRGLILPKKAA